MFDLRNLNIKEQHEILDDFKKTDVGKALVQYHIALTRYECEEDYIEVYSIDSLYPEKFSTTTSKRYALEVAELNLVNEILKFKMMNGHV